MKFIVGLGNPGEQYQNTRHNVGFMVLNALAGDKHWAKSKSGLLEYAWITWGEEKVELIKPITYMNNSGQAVKYALTKHRSKFTDLYVVHDDLDISLGNYKIQHGKGPKEHGGISSIEHTLKTDQFWRVRIGVEGVERQGKSRTEKIPGKAYVLQPFSSEEQLVVQDVIQRVIDELTSQFSYEKN